jgi:hypothetical protein
MLEVHYLMIFLSELFDELMYKFPRNKVNNVTPSYRNIEHKEICKCKGENTFCKDVDFL